GELIEIAVDVDDEAAEAVSELFNRFNGGGYAEDNAAGEAGGGGAVIEVTGVDDFGQPIPDKYRVVVKTYLKPGKRGETIRRQIEEGLWRLSLLYPIPEPQVRVIQEEDWATAWKKFYKPLRIGRRVVLKPTWEAFRANDNDIVIHLDPGMAFGTGMHPTTRLCIIALEELVQPGDRVLDLGTGSGVLAFVAANLGAAEILATDIDPLAVRVARENAELNNISTELLQLEQGSVPAGKAGHFRILVANILAEVLVNLFAGNYGNPLLAEPLQQDGYLILSGILAEKVEMVTTAAAQHGFQPFATKQEGDWVALVMQRPQAS
ncbi:MAG: 50S ribosomal protein L11 methyltransferase, partial [Caldilineaceae bacterium]|nr:50S ribosomal protein L11 methyltransferase [Caldilineaceae bacterium]